MSFITIPEHFEIDLNGKNAIVTGGASGIGLAAGKILSSRGAKVHILDIAPLEDPDAISNPDLIFHQCDVTAWVELRNAFQRVGRIDMVFANAGVGETTNYFTDQFDDNGNLQEPPSTLIDVNLRGMLYVIKLAWFYMKKQKCGGSIVITTSATAYVPWQSLAVSVRSLLTLDNITINAIAPGATITKFLPEHLASAVKAIGAPVSDAHTVARALVFAATAKEPRRVEDYGKDKAEDREEERRWNGRVIITLGDQYTEVEEKYADLRSIWLGEENARLFRSQQAATDGRLID
ncbi:MAG: hypothetical protein Q9179_007476 [Wetmoreana sp. 5 TL-2023]